MTADVAVVGAGPAGSWTAFSLARRGARVLLIDPSHPREKPCGGGVTGRALGLILPVIDARGIHPVVIRSARFAASSTSAVATIPLDMTKLWVASRTDLDGLLLKAAGGAGAEFLNARVTSIRRVRGGFELETTGGVQRAAFLIGADGTNSSVRRTVACPFRRDQLSIATGFFAHGSTSHEIVLEFVANPPGYIWSFPRHDHLAIGICAQADAGVTAGALRNSVAQWIERTGLARGRRLQPYAWPIPSLSAADFDTLTPSGPRWCLVGDAAGLVDPITREGIYFGLRSAEAAADAVCSADAVSPQHYGNRIRDEIGRDLAHAARLKASFFRPRFTRLLIDALQRSESIAKVMTDLLAGDQSYAGLKWRLFKTLEFGVGARLLLSAIGNHRAREHARSGAES